MSLERSAQSRLPLKLDRVDESKAEERLIDREGHSLGLPCVSLAGLLCTFNVIIDSYRN